MKTSRIEVVMIAATEVKPRIVVAMLESREDLTETPGVESAWNNSTSIPTEIFLACRIQLEVCESITDLEIYLKIE